MKTQKFFQSKLAIVLAILPVINLLFFLIGFLFAPHNNYSVLAFEAVILVASIVLFQQVPSFGWILVYVACTISALMELRHLRATSIAFDRGALIRTLVVIMLAVLLIVVPRLSPDREEDYVIVEEKTKAILIAVVENDINGWKAARHPKDLSHLNQLDWRELGLFREELAANDCLPEGEVGVLRQVWINETEEIRSFTIDAQYVVSIGDKLYKVTVQYVNDYKGNGIEKVSIALSEKGD